MYIISCCMCWYEEGLQLVIPFCDWSNGGLTTYESNKVILLNFVTKSRIFRFQLIQKKSTLWQQSVDIYRNLQNESELAMPTIGKSIEDICYNLIALFKLQQTYIDDIARVLDMITCIKYESLMR